MALIRAVAFDFGHTLVDEQRDASVPLDSRAVHLMPDVFEVLPRIPVPMAVWANTRTATSSDLRQFLDRAGIGGQGYGIRTVWLSEVTARCSAHPHNPHSTPASVSAGKPVYRKVMPR